jgi:hypothetical protein
VAKAGTIGAQLDLDVRAGDTLGPFTAQLTDPVTALPINLTGCTFEAAVSELDTEDGLVPLTVTITDAVNGWISFKLADSTALEVAASDFFKAARAYSWYLKRIDTAGNKLTIFYGYVNVAKKEPT